MEPGTILKYFKYGQHLESSQPYEVDTISIFILEMKKQN